MALIALHVDDLFIYSPSIGVIKNVKEILEYEFEMKDFCEVSTPLVLKIEIYEKKESIRIFQKMVLKKF